MKLSDLQSKKIVSIISGRNIGSIVDVNVTDEGRIDYLIIEENRGFFSLNRETNYKIMWEEISKIGEDVILVKKE